MSLACISKLGKSKGKRFNFLYINHILNTPFIYWSEFLIDSAKNYTTGKNQRKSKHNLLIKSKSL